MSRENKCCLKLLDMAKEKFSPVKAEQDDSGHWYIIPNELSEKFSELNNKICGNGEDYESLEEFEKLFNGFMTGGDLNLVQLYVKEDVV